MSDLPTAATEPSEKVNFDMFAHGLLRDLDAQIRSLENGADMCAYTCDQLRALTPHMSTADWHRLLQMGRSLAFISAAMSEAAAEDRQ